MAQLTRSRILGRGLAAAFALVAAAAARADEKAESYPLSAPPLEVLDRLAGLDLGAPPRLGDDERKLLTKVWALKAKGPAAPAEVGAEVLLEAMLFASGVEDAAARRKYRERFAALLAEARGAVSGAPDDRQRGERLMKFLHGGVMKKGYDAGQTSLAAVLDGGKFNCVSASALYYLAGTGLGLRLRAVAIPGTPPLAGHASLDLLDGDRRVQVEPTNPDGFDWGEKVKRPGVIVIGFVPDRKDGHEVDGLGLAAMIYSNRGVALGKEKPPRRLEALRCYLAALALDPAGRSAGNNLLGTFVNWGPELAGEKKFEEAVRVLEFGQKVAPGHDALRNNGAVVWRRYVDALLEAGKDREALAAAGRAAAATGEAGLGSGAAHFIRLGEARRKKGWEEALAVAERGARVLAGEEAEKLREWRARLFRRWSQQLLEQKPDPDCAGSLKVLARAHALDPNEEGVVAGIAYHTQEAMRLLDARGGPAAAAAHFRELRGRFPKVDEVAEAAAAHAQKAVTKLTKAKKFAEAVAAADKYGPLVADGERRADLAALAWSDWAAHLAAEGQWEAALKKCAEGLKAHPGQERLVKRVRITVDRWAEPAIKESKWDEAIRRYDVGLSCLPGDGHLEHNRESCEARKKKGK